MYYPYLAMYIFTPFRLFFMQSATCCTLLPSEIVTSFLSIYTQILSPDCFKMTSIGLFLPFQHNIFVKIHKISIFGKISLDFLCWMCYNTYTKVTKVLQSHITRQGRPIPFSLFCVVRCVLWLAFYQTYNHSDAQ